MPCRRCSAAAFGRKAHELRTSRRAGGERRQKVYAAKANLRCPADAIAMEIEEISADANVVESPQRQTKVTMNWNYVYRRKPSQGTVTFDVGQDREQVR